MSRRLPPPPPDEPADSQSCDGGNCDAPSVGWRWFTDMRAWLPCCDRHVSAKGVPPEFIHRDPELVEGSTHTSKETDTDG